MKEKSARRYPIGAEVTGGGVSFRVWAPKRSQVAVVIDPSGKPRSYPLQKENDGYFSASVEGIGAGAPYGFRLDSDEKVYPDPASRYQPEGPHGPSVIVDPTSYEWGDGDWRGPAEKGQVVYEFHVGTFTQEGTWRAAIRHLASLAELGVTTLEMMPVAEFPGEFGWGYDGVALFAPTRLYGTPDDLRAFVDAAHQHGLAVVLDVVYNHLGPDGNYLLQFSDDYFTDSYDNEWGDAINFDGTNSAHVREFFVANAGYWVDEFHFDGLRLDATQQIFDSSGRHILREIGEAVRAAAVGRRTWVVNENETQEAKLVRTPEEGGYGLDAIWNDDFHHSATVALTGHSEAYYSDYAGTAQELLSACKWGFLFQGQYYTWQKKRRGTPSLDIPPHRFVTFLQNHDQISNSACGDRIDRVTTPGRLRAMTALLLLAPQTPMLFQGQEFGASTPFCYFADHEPALAAKVTAGRREFVSQFPSLASPEMQARIDEPSDRAVFEKCKLRDDERTPDSTIRLHRDLLRLRRETGVIAQQRSDILHGAVLSTESFVLRWIGGGSEDRLLLVNLGRDLPFSPAPEPLLAEPDGFDWEIEWSSEHPDYGGSGIAPVLLDDGWRIPGHAAVLLRPVPKIMKSKE